MAGSLRAGVDAEEGDARAEAHVDGAAAFFDVGPGVATEDETGFGIWFFEDERVFKLDWVGACAVGALAVRGLGSVGGEGRFGRGDVVLEEAVVFECDAADTAEDGASHEVVGVGAEAVDNVCEKLC